jgi:hypothetical protein
VARARVLLRRLRLDWDSARALKTDAVLLDPTCAETVRGAVAAMTESGSDQ